MIDLHTHTTSSDGTFSPQELLEQAVSAGLEAMAITDHDTFAGYFEAAPMAAEKGFDLVCGIEISCKFEGRSVHLLGYFLRGEPGIELRDWLEELRESRHGRNQELVAKMQRAGFDVSLEEWYRRGGNVPGRPHLARMMIDKGYVQTLQEAFDKYLAEGGEYYTPRLEPSLAEGIERIAAGGGLPVVAHPLRITRDWAKIVAYLTAMREIGLRGFEVHHSDHSAEEQDRLGMLAVELGMLISGGSDFHGLNKPAVELGTGIEGNVRVPRAVLDELRVSAI